MSKQLMEILASFDSNTWEMATEYYCFVLLKEPNPKKEDGCQEIINPGDHVSPWIVRQQIVKLIMCLIVAFIKEW